MVRYSLIIAPFFKETNVNCLISSQTCVKMKTKCNQTRFIGRHTLSSEGALHVLQMPEI